MKSENVDHRLLNFIESKLCCGRLCNIGECHIVVQRMTLFSEPLCSDSETSHFAGVVTLKKSNAIH